MFEECYEFNQPLNNWDVKNVISMSRIFYNSDQFCKHQSIDSWNLTYASRKDDIYIFKRILKYKIK